MRLRLNKIILILLLFNFSEEVFSGLDDQYKQQQKFKCTSENAQFEGGTKGYPRRYSVTADVFIEYWNPRFNGWSYYISGKVNTEKKYIPFLIDAVPSIEIHKVEGDQFVKYSCRSDTNPNNYNCNSLVKKEVLGIRR